MSFVPFNVLPHNKHYEGAYGARALAWRRVCAVEKANNILALLKERDIPSILEVGAGTGALLAELKKRGIGRVYEGVDVSDPSDHVDPQATGLRLISYDGTTLPYPDKYFDFCYASHVLEHVLEPRSFVHEIARVTRGCLYFEVPCELNLRTTHSALQMTLGIGHINCFTPESLMILLQTSRIKVINSRLFDHTLDVHSFFTNRFNGTVKMIIRRGFLNVNQTVASRLFTYHFGVLGTPLPTVS